MNDYHKNVVQKYGPKRIAHAKSQRKSRFWGLVGDGIPWFIGGYGIGYAFGLFLVGRYLAWPIIKVMFIEPIFGPIGD